MNDPGKIFISIAVIAIFAMFYHLIMNGSESWHHECQTEAEKEKLQAYVIECIKHKGPENGSDCSRLSKELICPRVEGRWFGLQSEWRQCGTEVECD